MEFSSEVASETEGSHPPSSAVCRVVLIPVGRDSERQTAPDRRQPDGVGQMLGEMGCMREAPGVSLEWGTNCSPWGSGKGLSLPLPGHSKKCVWGDGRSMMIHLKWWAEAAGCPPMVRAFGYLAHESH